MRFIFWGISRRTKRKLKILLLIFTLLAGVFLAAENRYAIMRTADIKVVPRPDIIPTESVWASLNAKEAKIWPLLWVTANEYEERLERLHPVTADLKLAGWGDFRVVAEILTPAVKFFWNQNFWYLSNSGRLWPVTLEDNKNMDLSGVLERPILQWGTARTQPIDNEERDGDVYISSLPMAKIRLWYSNIDYLGWTGMIKYVQASVLEGSPVVRLVFKAEDGSDGIIVLFADDPADWREIGLALKKIYPDLEGVSSKLFIDTTYKDKILVRNRVE